MALRSHWLKINSLTRVTTSAKETCLNLILVSVYSTLQNYLIQKGITETLSVNCEIIASRISTIHLKTNFFCFRVLSTFFGFSGWLSPVSIMVASIDEASLPRRLYSEPGRLLLMLLELL